MGHPTPPFEGACLCGAVRVRLTAMPLLTSACHCRDCQKLSAGAFSMTTMFPAIGFASTGEVVRGGLGSISREHYFCKSCLNFVFSRIAEADHRVNLRTSLLDNAADFPPFVEFMTQDKLPWVSVPARHSFPRYPQSAEELQALFDDYASAGRA